MTNFISFLNCVSSADAPPLSPFLFHSSRIYYHLFLFFYKSYVAAQRTGRNFCLAGAIYRATLCAPLRAAKTFRIEPNAYGRWRRGCGSIIRHFSIPTMALDL